MTKEIGGTYKQDVMILGRTIGEQRTLDKKRVGTYGEGLLFFVN
jgi:hypothetical protein